MSLSNLATSQHQLRLELCSPIEHHNLLHSQQQEHVAAWSKPDNKWQMLDRFKSEDALCRFFDCPDVYVSPNEFYGWRRLVLLAGLNAVYLDFDAHKQVLTQKEIRTWSEKTLKKIARLGWPMPNALIFSGRGFHLYWRHHRQHKNALPRWQALVRHMRQTLDSDPMSADSCRVLRVVGTTNSKVPDFRVHGEKIAEGIYEFEHLYETILKPQKAEIRDIRAARVRAELVQPDFDYRYNDAPEVESLDERQERARKRLHDPKKHTSIFTYWRNVHKDVWLIAQSLDYAGNGVPEGMRTPLLEILAASLCWFTNSHALEDEVTSAAQVLMPTMSAAEVLQSTATLRAAAQRAANGNLVLYEGRLVDSRYRYSRAKIWEKIGFLVDPQLVERLAAIVPDDVAEARKEASEKGRDRVAEGRYAKGHADEQTRATARLLKAQGQSYRQIAAELGQHHKTIARWCE